VYECYQHSNPVVRRFSFVIRGGDNFGKPKWRLKVPPGSAADSRRRRPTDLKTAVTLFNSEFASGGLVPARGLTESEGNAFNAQIPVTW
jgi:hypothetical protein